MIGKLTVLGAALCCTSANVPPVPPSTTFELAPPSPYRGSFETVPRISCMHGSGSGVRISDDIVITAAHVSDNAPCGIDAAPVETVYREPGKDFAAVRGELGRGFRAVISCEGIKAGERYHAFGYVHGGKPNVEPLLGTNQRDRAGNAMLRGRVYRGMSGGGVFVEGTGAVVAITVMLNLEVDWAYVVPLSETYLCRS